MYPLFPEISLHRLTEHLSHVPRVPSRWCLTQALVGSVWLRPSGGWGGWAGYWVIQAHLTTPANNVQPVTGSRRQPKLNCLYRKRRAFGQSETFWTDCAGLVGVGWGTATGRGWGAAGGRKEQTGREECVLVQRTLRNCKESGREQRPLGTTSRSAGKRSLPGWPRAPEHAAERLHSLRA